MERCKPQSVGIALEKVVPVFGADPDVVVVVFSLIFLEDAGALQGFITFG